MLRSDIVKLAMVDPFRENIANGFLPFGFLR